MIDIETIKQEILEVAKTIPKMQPKSQSELFQLPMLMPLKLQKQAGEIADHFIHINKKSISYKSLARYSDREFIENAYRVLLKHDPDPQGLHMYKTKMRQGMTRAEVLVRIRYSAEGKSHAVRIRGLIWPSAVAFFLKIPVIGYFVQMGMSILLLPKKLKIHDNEIAMIKERLFINEMLIEKKINDAILRLNELGHRYNKIK